MKRIIGIAVAVALFCAAGAFAVDVSIGFDIPLGMSYWDHPSLDDSINGFLYGGDVVLDVMFAPRIAGEFKIGLVVDSYNQKNFLVLGDDWDFNDRYLNVVGLLKFYVSPSFFLGAGLEYNYYRQTRAKENVSGFSDTMTRDDLTDTTDIDPLFILATIGFDVAVSPVLSVPIAFNVAYGISNIPEDVTRAHIYGTIGIRYRL